MRTLTWIAAVIVLAAASYWVLATAGVLIAGAMRSGGVESVIWMSSVGILVAAGLLTGILFLRANAAASRRRKQGLPR